MPERNPAIFEPIGYVKTDVKDECVWKREHISELVVDERLVTGLEGIKDYSHIYVLFWMHMVPVEKRSKLKVHPRGHEELPLTGVFAVRTYVRPNPIGLTIVELLSVEDNILKVAGLDAINNTPILDIKPYDHQEVIPNIKVPKWWLTLKDTDY